MENLGILQVPPAQRPLLGKKKVADIVFPEDELMKMYRKRNPDW